MVQGWHGGSCGWVSSSVGKLITRALVGCKHQLRLLNELATSDQAASRALYMVNRMDSQVEQYDRRRWI